MYPYNIDENINVVKAAEEELPAPIVQTSRVAMLIEEAVKDEITDSIYYMEMAEKEEDSFIKELYKTMSDDETRHSKILEEIYKDITGIKVPNSEIEKRVLNDDYVEAAKEDMVSELKGAAFYRDLISVIEDKDYAEEINLIMNDEQSHGIINSAILTLRKQQL